MLSGPHRLKEGALFALEKIVGCNKANSAEVVRAGGIAALAALLKGTDDDKGRAADMLWRIAERSYAYRVRIGQSEAIPLLVALLKGTETQKEKAALTLGYIALDSIDNATSIAECGAIDQLKPLLRGSDGQKEYAAYAFAALTKGSVPNRIEAAKAGVVPLLVQLLNGADGQKENAAVAFAYIASDKLVSVSKETLHRVIVLIESLEWDSESKGCRGYGFEFTLSSVWRQSGRDCVTEVQKSCAAFALGNITSGNVANALEIVQPQGIDRLIALLSGTLKQREYSSYSLAILVRTKTFDVRKKIDRKGIIPLLIGLLEGSDKHKNHAALVLRFLVLDNEGNGTEFVNAGGVRRLIALLQGSDIQKAASLTILSGLIDQNEEHRVRIVEDGVIAPLIELLSGTEFQKEKLRLY